jgi:predicted MarR family transcription regulator
VSQLLGGPYSSAQMTYDLRRLRLKDLIVKVPKSNTYTLTPEGTRFAIFYAKCHGRLLRPLLVADRPPATPELRQAIRTIDRAVEDYRTRGHLQRAA